MGLVLITYLLAGLLPAAATRNRHESGEWAMQMWAMTAEHHRWPTPSPEPIPLMRAASKAPQQELQADERAALKAALERMADCLTGRLVYDANVKLLVPEFQAGCNVR